MYTCSVLVRSHLQILLRTGIQRSKKAPSALHPYGYMKDKFVWSLISAVGIFCLGAGVTVVHGFHGLFVQQQLEHLTAGLTGMPSYLLLFGASQSKPQSDTCMCICLVYLGRMDLL